MSGREIIDLQQRRGIWGPQCKNDTIGTILVFQSMVTSNPKGHFKLVGDLIIQWRIPLAGKSRAFHIESEITKASWRKGALLNSQ